MTTFRHEDKNMKNIKFLLKDHTFRQIINSKCFENALNYPNKTDFQTRKICEHCGSSYEDKDALIKYKKAQKNFRIEDVRLYNLFKEAMFYEAGITDHPKADVLFGIAWEQGHANGFSEVYGCFEDMLPIIN